MAFSKKATITISVIFVITLFSILLSATLNYWGEFYFIRTLIVKFLPIVVGYLLLLMSIHFIRINKTTTLNILLVIFSIILALVNVQYQMGVIGSLVGLLRFTALFQVSILFFITTLVSVVFQKIENKRVSLFSVILLLIFLGATAATFFLKAGAQTRDNARYIGEEIVLF